MSAKICASKLTKEFAKIRKEPLPGVVVQPNENNIREWHFCLLGHKDSPYRGGAPLTALHHVHSWVLGVFHGKLVFPPEYPMKPPAIYMLTPNGRFDINVRICTSYSDCECCARPAPHCIDCWWQITQSLGIRCIFR